jgi:hypothetical protein
VVRHCGLVGVTLRYGGAHRKHRWCCA